MIALWRCYGPVTGVESLIYAGVYYLKKHILKRALLSRSIHDYRMYLNLNDPGISKTLAIVGKRELEHVYILKNELREGMTVWDIGANIGYYVLMEAKYVGSTGKVYAVEPSPSNYELLKKNLESSYTTHGMSAVRRAGQRSVSVWPRRVGWLAWCRLLRNVLSVSLDC